MEKTSWKLSKLEFKGGESFKRRYLRNKAYIPLMDQEHYHKNMTTHSKMIHRKKTYVNWGKGKTPRILKTRRIFLLKT